MGSSKYGAIRVAKQNVRSRDHEGLNSIQFNLYSPLSPVQSQRALTDQIQRHAPKPPKRARKSPLISKVQRATPSQEAMDRSTHNEKFTIGRRGETREGRRRDGEGSPSAHQGLVLQGRSLAGGRHYVGQPPRTAAPRPVHVAVLFPGVWRVEQRSGNTGAPPSLPR